MQKLKKIFATLAMMFALSATVMVPTTAFASGAPDCTTDPELCVGANDFDDAWNRIVAWSTGTFGKMAAGGMVLIGVVAGMARQSLMPFATGAGAGLGLGIMPGIVDSMFTAGVPVVVDATTGVVTVVASNPATAQLVTLIGG